MYYPYFRGKRFELVLLRERAAFLAKNHIHPIVEPVKEPDSQLESVVEAFAKHGVESVFVANPLYGELANDTGSIIKWAQGLKLDQYSGFSLGYIAHANTNADKLKQTISHQPDSQFSIIHYGFADGKGLSTLLTPLANVREHIFIDGYTSKIYRKYFESEGKLLTLIRDGFKIRRNKDYPDTEYFSDLHMTYEADKLDGFGDFLIVGDPYREGGGPAYAVVIHMSYLQKDGSMYVRHFLSDRTESPSDPAGKFGEALSKLVAEVNSGHSLIPKTSACKEYCKLHEQGWYPGLGYIKKLSMQHHLELIADFLNH